MSSQCDNLYKYITEASHPIYLYLYVYAKMCVVYMWCKHCKYFCVSIFNFIIKFERAKEKNIRPHPPFNAMEILFTLHTPWALPFSVYFIYYGILYCVQLKFFLSIRTTHNNTQYYMCTNHIYKHSLIFSTFAIHYLDWETNGLNVNQFLEPIHVYQAFILPKWD